MRRYFVSLVTSLMDALPQLKDVERLSPRVVRVLGQNPSPYTLQGTNSYVIGTGPSRILLDTTSPVPHTAATNGTHTYVANLRRFLLSEGAKIGEILVSHRHFDHVGAIGELLHDADIVIDVKTTRCSKHESYKQNEYTTPITWHHLTDGEQFRTEGATLRSMHTPGHTDDHVSYVLEEENALFTGDKILGHGPTTAEHLDRYIDSLTRLHELNKTSRFTRLYPAHGDIIDGEEPAARKIEEYLKHRVERVDQVRRGVIESDSSDGITAEHLLEKIYPNVTGMLKYGAMNNMVQALQMLVARGELESSETRLPDGSTVTRWRAKQPAGVAPSKLGEEKNA